MLLPKILAIGRVFLDTPKYAVFKTKFDISFYTPVSKELLMTDLKARFQDISAIWVAHGGLVCTTGNIIMDSSVISCFPASLRVIALLSVGFDRYDIPQLQKRGVIVTNTPAIASDLVADTALLLALNAFRLYPIFERAVRESGDTVMSRINVSGDAFSNGYPEKPRVPEPFQLGDYVGGMNVYTPKGRTVGIVGLGAVGAALARRLDAIGMKIRYTKRSKTDKIFPFPLTFHESFEDMVPHCDLLAFCCPLSPETRHMLNNESLKLCKRGVRVVNVGRGACINEDDLVEGLESGQVGYAGLDVYEFEPRIHPGLLSRWNVCLLPHVGNATVNNRMISAINCMENIEDVMSGGRGLTVVK
ncbi:hypothetical protein BABINDRAFT_167774 [Babjeviella inositovora NRRL Y-12698]|uniref:D-isomer specific 2-hydroxyacid dehydrogenase NAD-binding domain-containing protein n=1 Tax=Babjeviella inositovora NRRL Y-12698 TaxID=984486 RepID=A0A1E3QQA1_9ASCO|nr:uncharacterized protein BABINDRAFT_167774 [Babjeviella inositovora NRRL Y-12698]ODQ79252.1 hypothetical protein BABINDRAFT_167774 [Babjeviella inositovora NRRL Y-12698]